MEEKQDDFVDFSLGSQQRLTAPPSTHSTLRADDDDRVPDDGGPILIPKPSDDARDPLNWPLRKKITLLCTICFCAYAGALAPPVGQLAYFPQAVLYGKTPTQLSYSINSAVAGLLAGPIIFVPLARVVGRTSVIFWSLIGLFVCQIWAASMTKSDDYNAFIISRMFAGLCGGSPTILGSGSIVEMFFLHQRGRVFACYELSLLLGVVTGPTIGGFIVQNHSWTVAFWWTLAPVGLAIVLIFAFGEETRFARDGDSTIYPRTPSSFIPSRIATLFPGTKVAPQRSVGSIGKSFIAPFVIGTSPVTVIAGFYMFVSFGFTILLGVLQTIYLQTPVKLGGYGFSPERNAAFTFVSWATILAAESISLVMNDRLPLWAANRFGKGVWRPEFRLWNMWFPIIFAPIGLAIVGITLQYHLHYMVLALGIFLVGTCAQLSVPLLINYVIECFITHAVEVSVAMNVWRLAFGLGIGFFVTPWTDAVGRGWVFGMASLFVFAASIPVIILAWKGQTIRQLYPLKGLASSEEGEQVTSDDRRRGV